MLKGVLLAFGIMVALALAPLANLVGIPFGPFIGGYFGISHAASRSGSLAANAAKAARFGALLALVALAVAGAAAVAATLALGLSPPMALLAWLGAAVFTLHTGLMGALGAMYGLVRADRPGSRPGAVAEGR